MANQQGFTVWLTGMLGAGKTTLANYIAARLRQVGRNVEILDEDDLADDLWKELEGSNKDERITIARRLGVVAELLTRNNTCVLVACTSPYKGVRDENRRRIQRYIEVYVDCPTDDLIKRDSTGKYKKALSGEIPNFVGITEPYEPPGAPEVTVQTNLETVEAGGLKIFQSLLDLAYMTPEELKIITGTKMKANPRPRRGAKGAKAARARPAARSTRGGKAKAGKRKR
ncbi:MAG: adenylyl-sulfate kinase [Myxococcota bacterium]